MEFNVYIKYDNITFDYEHVIDLLKQAFEKKFKIKKEVSIVLVNENEIQCFNTQYRHIDLPTDVLSFVDDDDDENMGDIFVCVDKVYSQAKEYEHSNEREFAFLVCHGLLHLLGYDHIIKEDEEIMFKLQDEILNSIDIRR